MSTSSCRRRVALIHAVPVAAEPVHHAFAQVWPEAELVNILDDSLSLDRARDDELRSEMIDRIGALGDYAFAAGAHAILYTCSAFGPAIELVAARLAIPVLKPNEAMFHQALAQGGRVGMVATFAPSVRSMEAEFVQAARDAGAEASLEVALVPEALSALKEGDAATHNRLVAEAAASLTGPDVIMLAHFSTAQALEAVHGLVPAKTVLSSPLAAAQLVRARLGG